MWPRPGLVTLGQRSRPPGRLRSSRKNESARNSTSSQENIFFLNFVKKIRLRFSRSSRKKNICFWKCKKFDELLRIFFLNFVQNDTILFFSRSPRKNFFESAWNLTSCTESFFENFQKKTIESVFFFKFAFPTHKEKNSLKWAFTRHLVTCNMYLYVYV